MTAEKVAHWVLIYLCSRGACCCGLLSPEKAPTHLRAFFKSNPYQRSCSIIPPYYPQAYPSLSPLVRPLVEANYRRLMVYYLDLGQPDQALNIYHQCYRVLHKGFHISLSKEIQLLAKQIETSEQKYFE